METRARSSYPDSPHPGHGHPSGWITKPYSIMFTGFVLFILIFGIAIFLGYRQFETTRHDALTADKTTAKLLADVLLEHNKATIGILQSYAHRRLFIAAVKHKSVAGAYRHLSDLNKNADIDLTFVTDKRGILWANFPVFPEAIEKNMSNRDWYKGVSLHWNPYISTVYKLIIRDKPLAVAVCVPIFDEKGRPAGILGSSQRLGFIDDAIERVPFSPYTTVNVIDRAGKILYSNNFPYRENITGYRFSPMIEPAVKEKKQQIEINDPQKDQEKRYLTVVPVGNIGWSVILERTQRDIFRSEYRRFIEIGAISFLLFLLFLLIIFFLIYLRKATLFRKTEELLQAETKLQQSEESERETRDYLEKLIGYANAPIIVWDPQFRITRFNQAFEDLTGLKSEEVLGKEINLLFPEDRLEECFGHIRQATEGELWEVIEIPILHRDGSVRTVLWNSATIYSPDGKTSIATIAQGQDITERKRAEETLRRSEENFRNSLDDSPIGVRIVTIEGETIYTNRALLNIYGYDGVEELRTTPVEKRYTPESHADFLIRREKRQQGVDVPSEYTINIIRKDGEVRHLLVLRRGILWDGERQFQVIYQDITESKRAEAALRESEERFRAIIENAPFGYYRVGKDGLWQYINAVWEQMHSLSHKKIIGKPFEITQPEDSMEQAREYVKRALAGEVIVGEFGRLTRGGNTEYHSFNIQPVKHGKEIVAIEGFINDITERKRAEEKLRESEEKYRNILENIEDGYFEVDLAGNITFFNHSLYHILGYPREEMPGINNRVFMDAENAKKVFQAFNEVYVTGIPTKSFEWETIRKDGTRVYMEMSVSLIARPGEKPTGFRGIAHDVTERKRKEEELSTSRLQLRALATRLQKIREEERLVIAREIHDVMGGGLTGLKIELSRLLRKRGDADRGEKRVALMDRIHTSNALIDQMIHVVRRISADLRPSVLDDLGLIAALEWQLSEFTSRTEIPHEFATTFEYVNMEEDTAIAVFRIFQEALTNVARHSRATKVAVVLREGERSLFGDESLVLEIRDNGRGITEEEILNPESLGLLGMKERVLAFGGELSIRGEPGGGTALILKIPRKQGEAS